MEAAWRSKTVTPFLRSGDQVSLNVEKVLQIRRQLIDAWIPEIYIRDIRPLRTRSVEMDIAERESEPEIFESLLGIELKVGRRRLACPDVHTARYLQVFARLGCRSVAVPYDITEIPAIAAEMAAAWEKLEAALKSQISTLSPQAAGRLRSTVIRTIREEINLAGAGELMPLFDRSTKQRN